MEATAASHMAFIVTAYAAAAMVVAGLVAWVVLDYRLQRRTLSDLETRGLTRRSERAKEKA
jgi:heme exporter protein D